jgi:hypothetical protein
MELMWIIIALVLLGLVLVFFKSKSKTSSEQPKAGDEQSSATEKESPEVDLVKLNLRIRKSALNSDVTAKSEAVIDQLVALIPAINHSDMAGSDMKWTVNQIAKEYLPNKCIGPYIELNPQVQAEPEKIQTVLSNLEALSKELADVEQLLNNRDENEFNKKATFLKHRFNQNGDL